MIASKPEVKGEGKFLPPIYVRRVDNYVRFYCPGCGYDHHIDSTIFGWNGNLSAPSFDRSIIVRKDNNVICHMIIRNAIIYYQSDCLHALKSSTISMTPIKIS